MTKGQLAAYFEAVADRILPYADHRPLMLMRCPEGMREGKGGGGACFVQKHSGRGLVGRIPHDEVEGEEVLYLASREDLAVLAQFSVIELHGWGARMPDYDVPDWMVLDLDPDEGLPFSRVVEAAREVKAELDELGLESFVKTTGGKGLHVVVPFAPGSPGHDWNVVKALSAAIAEGMARRAPRRYVATMSKDARHGKVFVDHFRNARGATAILPYSPRARPGLPVAMPIAWKDLSAVDPQDFTVGTVPALLAKRRTDPWRALLATRQRLAKAIVRRLAA